MARRSMTSGASPPALPPVPPGAAPLALPAELTIYTVGELHPQWLAWLGQGAAAPHADTAAGAAAEVTAELQAAAVEQVDAAGLQLLLSLQRALADRGRSMQIHAPSQGLRGGCEALGLGAWLQAQTYQMAEGASS